MTTFNWSDTVDSTFVLKELSQYKNNEIICLTIDLGHDVNQSDLTELTNHFGAKLIVIDGKEAFANDAVLPAIRAHAKYLGIYPISSSLSRPIISRYAVEYARKLGCGAIIHTANQSQNTLRRLNGSIHELGFDGYYGSPYEFSALTREEKIGELKSTGLDKFQARGISGDANLWCREFESGSLENPESFWVPESLFDWTSKRANRQYSDNFSVRFKQGYPVAIDDVEIPLVELIEQTNQKVGSFQIGRYAGLEHLKHGEKVLEVREAPAAHIIMDAYRHIETATLDAELLREKITLEQLWVREALEGRWYGDLRLAAEAFISKTAQRVSGTIKYSLRNGAADICSIKADEHLYLTDRDEWEKKVAAVRGSRRLGEVIFDKKTDAIFWN